MPVSDADLYLILNVDNVTTVTRGSFSLLLSVTFFTVISGCMCLAVKAVHIALSLMRVSSSKAFVQGSVMEEGQG